MPRGNDILVLLAAAGLALQPRPGFAGAPGEAGIAGRSCAQVRAMITERVQDIGLAFDERLDRLTYPVRESPGGIPLAPPLATPESLYAAAQKVRVRPGPVILGLQARNEADLAVLKAAGCPDYDLPTDPETYADAALACETARLYDRLKVARREPEFATAVACDHSRWAVGQPMSEPGWVFDPPPRPIGPPDAPGAP